MVGRKLIALLVVGLLLAFGSTALGSGPANIVLAEDPTELGDGNWEYIYDVYGNPSGGTHILNCGLSGFDASQIVNQWTYSGWGRTGTLVQKWDWRVANNAPSWERQPYGSYAIWGSLPWILHDQPWAIDNPWHDPGEYNAVFPMGYSYPFPSFVFPGEVAADGQSLIFISKNQDRGPSGLLLTFRIVHPNPAATINWSNQSRSYESDFGSGTVPGPATAGDCDLDADVDWSDYQALETGFGTGTTWAEGDFDGDGDVDWADYQELEANFGKEAPVAGVGALSGPVAEPMTLSVLALGAAGLLASRRKRRA